MRVFNRSSLELAAAGNAGVGGSATQVSTRQATRWISGETSRPATESLRVLARMFPAETPEALLGPPRAEDAHPPQHHGGDRMPPLPTAQAPIAGSTLADTLFDAKLATFQQWQTTPWGRLRYSIAAANLTPHLQPGSRVLDVAGGNGLDAVELAARGHHVTIADISESALADARALAEKHGVGDRISTRLLSVDELAQQFAHNEFDVVLCHNLLQYVPDPKTLIAVLASMVASGGVVSVIAPNADADPLLTAVRNLDLDVALRQLDSPTRHTVTYGTETRACYAGSVTHDLAEAGLHLRAHCGIRSVCDLLVDDAVKNDPRFFVQLERLELAMATRAPYIHTARFFQLIATPKT
ncbi:MAG: methyltransferase domain-containing protein [Nocardia sp.]|nr:methyltransferase domain-containing protein [Nocardia sp.]